MKGIGGHTQPNKGLSDSWITPKNIIEALGPFDLDPCACEPQPWPCAAVSYTQEGLERDWTGRIWLNPPYSQVWVWLEKLAVHGKGTALIFARTETEGFVEQVWGKATAILFLYGRLFFHHPSGERAKGNSGGPSCLVAYGDHDAAILTNSKLKGSLVRNWR